MNAKKLLTAILALTIALGTVASAAVVTEKSGGSVSALSTGGARDFGN